MHDSSFKRTLAKKAKKVQTQLKNREIEEESEVDPIREKIGNILRDNGHAGRKAVVELVRMCRNANYWAQQDDLNLLLMYPGLIDRATNRPTRVAQNVVLSSYLGQYKEEIYIRMSPILGENVLDTMGTT